MRSLALYVPLAVLPLGTGVGIGLGLSEAPTTLRGPLPPNPLRVTASWDADVPIDQPLVAVQGQAADALAAAIDSAPKVEGVYHCPVASTAPSSVTLAFHYLLNDASFTMHASFTVTMQISFTGCRWIWVVRPSSPTRWWLTSNVLSDLRPLGTPSPASREP